MSDPYRESDVPAQAGRTVLITGANTGIGFEAARVLAQRGARVLLGCRSAERAEEARSRIVGADPKADVAIVQLDLGSLASVRDAAERVRDEPRLDLLINNAGIMMPPRQETADGFEAQFGVNHLGHFALTGLLLDRLKDTPDGRIVTVSSGAHRWGRIEFDDLQAERSYSRQARYGMSKLANLLFTYELQRRLQAANARAVAVACHPGVAETELSRNLPSFLQMLQPVLRWLTQSAADGALPTLRAATAPDVRGGDYYGPAHRFESVGPAVRVPSSSASRDREAAARLWDVSVRLTGVDPGLPAA